MSPLFTVDFAGDGKDDKSKENLKAQVVELVKKVADEI
jgi:hypothetical protein